MQILEYRVKVPILSTKNYKELLTVAISSENPNIVTIVQSGESDYANLPGRNNKNLKSGISRTNKLYNIPSVSSNPIDVTSFLKLPVSKNNINSNISVTSRCSNVDNIDNMFFLPVALLPSRTVVELDLTNSQIWNFTTPVIDTIIPLSSSMPTPSTKPTMFVYILFITNTTTTDPVFDTNLYKAYIIRLHKKMISLAQT